MLQFVYSGLDVDSKQNFFTNSFNFSVLIKVLVKLCKPQFIEDFSYRKQYDILNTVRIINHVG